MTVVAEGDRVVTREEVVELADAVAVLEREWSGIGTTGYGAQIVVHAESADEAVEHATLVGRRCRTSWPAAVAGARLAEVMGEDDAGDEDG